MGERPLRGRRVSIKTDLNGREGVPVKEGRARGREREREREREGERERK